VTGLQSLTEDDKILFWNIIEHCLVKFHGKKSRWAHAAAIELREKIESTPLGMPDDIFYHAEPFDIACDIAGEHLDITRFWKEYDAMFTES
jgi:hypothetical protein